MSTLNIQLLYRSSKRFPLIIHHLLPDLAPGLTLNGSNYPYLEQIFMVPKRFEPELAHTSKSYLQDLDHNWHVSRLYWSIILKCRIWLEARCENISIEAKAGMITRIIN